MKDRLLLLLFVLAKFALSYALVNPVYELHRDEFLHLDQGSHPAFGYLSVPPLTAWFAVLVKLLGNTAFWVRFFPCLFGALTLAVVWKTIGALGGKTFAKILGATALLLSVLLRLNLLFQPNSFDVLAWTTVFFCLVRFSQTQATGYVWLLAVVLGLGFLNKYNIVFLMAGMAPALLFPQLRKMFALRAFWLSMLLALAIVLPNLIWQFANGFPVVAHMKELSETQLANVDRAAFFKDQLLFFFGSVHVLLAGFLSVAFYRPFRPYRWLLVIFVVTMALFVALHAKNYYTIGLYPVFLAFGAVYLERRLRGKPGMVLQAASVAVIVGFFVLTYPLAFPVKEPQKVVGIINRHPGLHLARWEDGKDHAIPQDYADMLGWSEMAALTDRAFADVPDVQNTLIICDNYGQAGGINFYHKNKDVAAVSFNADYRNWFDLSHDIRNVILVREADNSRDLPAEASYFRTFRKIGSVQNPFAREKGTTVYLLRDATVNVNIFLENELRLRSAE